MGLSHSPKIITDGLVFAMDSGNDKSYKGPNITNIATRILQIGTTPAAGYSFTASTENVFIPTIGNITAKVNSGYNNYSAVSTQCCPGLFDYGALVSVSASTQYTYAILYKTTSGYTHPNFMYRYEYTSGSAYVTEGGVHSDSNRTHLGNGWYWAWGTFTTQATTAIINFYSFYYKYGTTTDNFYVAKALIVQGNYTGLHPKYWPDVNTTRSNTDTILDLTGKTTVTATNLTYESNGNFKFNGGTQSAAISNSIGPISNNFSISAWIRSTDIAATQNILSMNGPYFMRISGSKIRFNVLAGGTWLFQDGTTTLSSNTWYYLTMVYDYNASLWNGYINDKLEFSVAKSGTLGISTFYGYVGYTPQGGEQSNFFGEIAVAQYYNKALSSAEVRQNFNALRGRFGI